MMVADTALVVCHVTRARVDVSSDAWIAAVGAGGPIVTVALAVAVAPLAFRATRVNVVVAVTAIVVEPLTGTAVPLSVADTALVVCQVTTAVFVPCRDA